ncbi:cathepsin O isoform X3 [Rhincodon typus]|uniref:cathepsin O isoform X3 n=1 Tax=Rhincodon typus TaxID=259920 RepID=UPI00202EF1FF|nr:cathepsin O isoform X3 [Rhincodon typus]
MRWFLLLLCFPSIRFALPGRCSVQQPLRFQLPSNMIRGAAAAAHSENLFQQFVWKYNRSYAAGSPEFVHKYKVFLESIQRHYSLNLISSILLNESGSAIYGINQFSDMPPHVFRATYLSSRSVQLPKYTSVLKDTKTRALPPKFDWRDKNVVTPVRNQKSCGGCWAFSVVESIESSCAIEEGHLELLSAQEVIDCSFRDAGCKGGSPISALMWLNQSKAKLVKESEYPFNAQTGICHYFSRSTFGIAITGFKAYSFRYNEDIMMEKLLEWGPLVVVVDAVSWQDYLGGIIQHHCSQGKSNHAVVITGYDTTGDIPYWIVRNSWGTKWGIDGYVYIKMGRNICGIADSVAVAFV